jgi:hypothetical protein
MIGTITPLQHRLQLDLARVPSLARISDRFESVDSLVLERSRLDLISGGSPAWISWMPQRNKQRTRKRVEWVKKPLHHRVYLRNGP